MKRTEKQKKRILENLFDILCETSFVDVARAQMKKDINNKNITLDMDNCTIIIQNLKGTSAQYTISIN